MAIVKMKKLRLMAIRSEKDSLLRELERIGCVEFSELDESLADEGLVHSVFLRIEILDLSGDLDRKYRRVKCFNIIDTANSVHKVLPECRNVISDGGNDSHSGDYHSFVFHEQLLGSLLFQVYKNNIIPY